jgi:chemosensory pili system protein ChpC
MNTASQADIRGVLIQVAGARLLLPNATIAEVLSFADPDPVANAPDWLLGRIRWRGWQLPLIAFARLAGIADERGGLKALGGDPKAPFFALLTQGFPRLVTVSQAALAGDAADGEALPAGVQARVVLNEDAALLPDLEQVELLIGQALAQAA